MLYFSTVFNNLYVIILLEGGEESEERWIKNGRDSERCKWTVVERK